MTFRENDSFPLQGLVRLLLQREERGDWTVTPGGFWCHVQPADYPWPVQGWKLHISATPLSAPVVLERAATVLLRHGCAFKFTATREELISLVSSNCARGSSGKFITAYPRDDEHFRLLAGKLDRATLGLPGPAVLSDRPYRPGSLVHYRYGAFRGITALSNDGGYESLLEGPDGTLVKDERNAWFSPPAWAPSPLPGHTPPAAAAQQPSAVLLAERFMAHKAIKHSAKGGVFRAVDQHTGKDVVVKQARPHVGERMDGTDVRDVLRHEATMLDELAPLGFTPRAVALFEQQDSLFLAQEAIAGLPLRGWIAERTAFGSNKAVSFARITRMALQLAEIVAAVHGRGLLLRDLTPNNLMVTPDGDLRMIDLEYATRPGTAVNRVLTTAYASPEQVGAPMLGPAPELSSDLYALGATLFFLVSGSDPVLPEDQPACRPVRQRIQTLLDAMSVHSPAVRSFTPLIVALMDDDPSRRWDLQTVQSHLRTLADNSSSAPVSGTEGTGCGAPAPLSAAGQDRLVADGIGHLLATMDPSGDRLWPSSGGFGAITDPCSVQHGAAGVLQVLTRAACQLPDARLADAVAQVAGWIVRRLPAEPRTLPGLYFGRAGTAWALHDAALLLDDKRLAERAVDLARRLPTAWPNPDVCHGTAGAGMAHLQLWQDTGDSDLGDRMRACADALAAAAVHTPEGVCWPVPADFDSVFAGTTSYGFAHGTAGIGAFLLAAGAATGNQEYLALARAAADALAAAALLDGDQVSWPAGPGETHPSSLPLSWCNGAAGIGAFLVRMWQYTGEVRYRDLAIRAGRTVLAGSWQQSSVLCHGLAGSGEFLLDLADHLHAPRYRQAAADLAVRITARHALHEGRMVVADESMHAVSADYNTGLSGVIGFVLRLRHGGARMWMPAMPAPAASLASQEAA
ncbi:class IV lanthionine synthetase LanL [Streptomyces griseochromogenes]|uniref:class IV lanthionine synthetase LanL n=1 Tax=Streptomyces griseochromogenes TaxID=68214 RepID=UPI003795079B